MARPWQARDEIVLEFKEQVGATLANIRELLESNTMHGANTRRSLLPALRAFSLVDTRCKYSQQRALAQAPG